MSNLSDAKLRLAALQEEAFTCTAKPFFFYVQNKFPYWTNRVGPGTYDWDSQELMIVTRDIISRLVVGHITEGVAGAPEDDLDTYIEAWQDKIADSPMLTSATYTTVPTYLIALAPTPLADSGLQIFVSEGLAVVQVGIEFTTRMQIFVSVPEAFP